MRRLARYASSAREVARAAGQSASTSYIQTAAAAGEVLVDRERREVGRARAAHVELLGPRADGESGALGNLSESNSKSAQLSSQKPVRQAVFSPCKPPLRFRWGLRLQVRFFFNSNRLDQVAPRLRIGLVCPCPAYEEPSNG